MARHGIKLKNRWGVAPCQFDSDRRHHFLITIAPLTEGAFLFQRHSRIGKPPRVGIGDGGGVFTR